MFVEPVKGKCFDDEILVKPGNPQRLIDMLPLSAVSVYFSREICIGGYGIDDDVAVAMLQGMPEGIAEFLPNLKTVQFEFGEYSLDIRDRIRDSALLRGCREVGVEISDKERISNWARIYKVGNEIND